MQTWQRFTAFKRDASMSKSGGIRAVFPSDFMFRLKISELQINRSQIATGSQKHRDPRFPPYAFTEHGAIMAATVVNSPRAVEMWVYVVRAFVKLREVLSSNTELARSSRRWRNRSRRWMPTRAGSSKRSTKRFVRLWRRPQPSRDPLALRRMWKRTAKVRSHTLTTRRPRAFTRVTTRRRACRLRCRLGPLFSRRLLVHGSGALRQFVLGDIFHVRGDGPHMAERILDGA